MRITRNSFDGMLRSSKMPSDSLVIPMRCACALLIEGAIKTTNAANTASFVNNLLNFNLLFANVPPNK